MAVIYKPTGKALEYSPLAVNLYTGCLHSCRYCYAPGITRKKRSDFHSKVTPRKDILKHLEADCKKMQGDPREILLCFTCDLYQPFVDRDDVTREALLILEKYHMKVQVLTKGGSRAARDFDILERNEGWSFGTTLSLSEDMRKQWEPNAAPISDRVLTVITAHAMGIQTWISVEPVIASAPAIYLMTILKPHVDFWRIGKINYHRYIEERINWKVFLEHVEMVLAGKKYYIKRDLWEAAGRTWDETPPC